jgi:CRISPR/Cas system Type II protein with McrA/HNH and RuvC-like nuclease domain
VSADTSASPPSASPERVTRVHRRRIERRRHNASMMQHMSTANVARDMNLLRQALGKAKLNYDPKTVRAWPRARASRSANEAGSRPT